MPNTQPLVSILIPCYNSAPFIAETLESVIAQTYTPWECIIVDDHSTDNSVEIIEQFCEKYPKKIKLFTNPGKGACAARNFAFEKSQGNFIQYLDADDLISADKLEKQVKALINKESHIAVCNTWHFFNTPANAYNTDSQYVFSSDSPSEFLINLWGGYGTPHLIQTNAWLSPRKLIEESGLWNESLHKDQDGEFFARVVLKSDGIVYTPDVKSYYRKHNQGSNIGSQKERKHIESNLLATRLKEQHLFKENISQNAKQAISIQYKIIAINAWPQYKDISKTAINRCNHLGGTKYLPVMGGRFIELIKYLFGWHIAKNISYYAHYNKTLRKFFSKENK